MIDTAPPHTHRITLLLAVVALLLAGYAFWRGDSTRDREDATRERVQLLEAANSALRAELAAVLERETRAHVDMQAQAQLLASLPQQVRELTAAHEDLRNRTERPQRAWSRAEAAYLVELAQRRLSFDRDTATAIVALASADQRLAALRDPSLDAVRARIAKDLQALRAVPDPNRAGIVARLSAIEGQVERLSLKGVLVGQRVTSAATDESASMFARATNAVATVFSRLFAVHRLGDNASIVSLEEQSLRRQHLSLLVYAARHAAMRSDAAAYRASLDAIDAWLGKYFGEGAVLDALVQEIDALQKIEIAPVLPDISGAAQLLAR